MKNILYDQNPHWQNKNVNLARRYKLDKLISYLPLRQIITITGIRRCGKSSLARLAINHLLESGTDPQNILFVNLEQPYFLEYRHDPNYLNVIYDEYLKLFNPEGKVYVVFDEIQYFEHWPVYIKSKYENSDIKYIITGSNSSMLSSEFASMLTGRSLNIHLDTFSFTEFLEHRNIGYKTELERIANRIVISRAKDEYLRWGGFFEVIETSDEVIKKEILLSYAKNIIYRDIVPRFGIRNSEVVERLFFYLLSTASGILNYTALSKTFDMSDKSIKEYISYFEDVFLFRRIDRFHNKPKEMVKSMKKLYVMDNGFLMIVPKNSENLGVSLENLVFNHLYKSDNRVTYLKDTYEVDFYSGNTLYQVSYDISDEKTRKRKLGSFGYFKKESDICKLITHSTNEAADGVEVISMDEFLVESSG